MDLIHRHVSAWIIKSHSINPDWWTNSTANYSDKCQYIGFEAWTDCHPDLHSDASETKEEANTPDSTQCSTGIREYFHRDGCFGSREGICVGSICQLHS